MTGIRSEKPSFLRANYPDSRAPVSFIRIEAHQLLLTRMQSMARMKGSGVVGSASDAGKAFPEFGVYSLVIGPLALGEASPFSHCPWLVHVELQGMRPMW